MQQPVYPTPSRSARLNLLEYGGGPLDFVGTTATSTAVTATGSLAGVSIGDLITGPGVPADTHVVAMDDAAHTMTLSHATTSTVVGATLVATKTSGFNGHNFRLMKTSTPPAVNSVITDFTEADFVGYSALPLVMTTGWIDGTGLPIAQSQLLAFLCSASTTPNTIYGWWVDDGVNVLMAALLDAPVGIASVGSEISGILRDSYPPGQGFVQVTP